ncbi:MAG: hypothetical protein M3N43_02850 [Actinomycetota bacterium]|nr:hypothetical protein [Actinomycetota bacterium]
MGLTEVGLIVLGVGVLLIVIAFFAQLLTGTATTSSDLEVAAPGGGGANPIAAIIAAVADALKALGELLTGVLGMFNPLYRPGVFLALVGGLLAIAGTFV